MAGRDFDVETVPQAQSYRAATGRRRVHLAWTDASGPHEASVDAKVVLGSAAQADIVLADSAVSRLHAELEPRPDGPWITDLDSTNGTFVQEVLVTAARVPDGGRVRLGGVTITVRSAAPAEPAELWPDERFGPLVGRSRAMRELFARLARIAPSDAPALIHGETGTGKELVAWAIHEASPRASGPFVIVDCGSLPETLLEAELFGHAKGAFTGAVAARAGGVESAEGGTVFLDEIGELPLAMQPKLLRAIESRTVRRLGETGHRKVDVRFIAATHRDLRALVNRGAFREDLYFRLAVLPALVPPLRDRPEDIPALVDHFLPPEARARMGPELARELGARALPGNVRELRNFVERALTFGTAEALAMPTAPAGAGGTDDLPPIPFDRPFKEIRERWVNHLEREYVRELLRRHGGNVSAVAQAAGLARTYVHRLIRRYDL
jgi:transcriptional regulator with GAF, ATPase, and Fis domain